jgi:hypothetical protein
VGLRGNTRSLRRMGAGRIAAVGAVVVSLVATALVFGPVGPVSAAACTGAWSGNGTLATPFLITSRADLEAIDTCLNNGDDTTGQYFKQMADISLSSSVWAPIGGTTWFAGTYDGGCFSITGMTINSPGVNYLGFFGKLGRAATINNMRITGASITGGSTGGGFIGILAGGSASGGSGLTVNGVIASGTITASGSFVGGLIGSATEMFQPVASLTRVSFDGTITAPAASYVAGLSGYGSGTVDQASVIATITADFDLSGIAESSLVAPMSITDSYSQINATVTQAGQFAHSAAGISSQLSSGDSITRSYAAGTMAGTFTSTASSGTIDATATPPTLSLATGTAWNPMLGIPVTASNGSGSLGTGTTAGARTGSNPYVFSLTAGTGLTTGTVTSIQATGVNAGFVGVLPTGATITNSFFDNSLASTPTSGVLNVSGSNVNTSTTVTGLTPASTTVMKTASTYSGWSSSIWNLTNGSYPTLKWPTTYGCFATGGGGGGGGSSSGGGGSSTPVVDPTPTPTATPTPTPTATVAAAVALDPIPNQVNANIPAGGVPQGGSVFLVNGVPAAVSVAPNAQRDATALDISGPDFTMKLSGRGDDADPLGLTERNALILQSKQTTNRSGLLEPRSGRLAKCVLRTPLAVSSGTGFQPGAPVKMYLLPSTYIGELMADAAGSYSGSLPVPVGVLTGSQTLQANGFSPSGVVRSLSLGITVKRGRVVTTKAEKGNVFFEPLSTVISPQGEATLNGLVRKAKKQGVRTVVLGFVQETATTSNDDLLSTQRARAVASYLRDRGLKGAYSIRGDGVAGPGDAARRVNVNVTYQSGC